jgi:hypothetical protein
MGGSQTFQRYSRFKAGRTFIDYDESPGRPESGSTSGMIERVRQIIREDRRRNINEVKIIAEGMRRLLIKVRISSHTISTESWLSA